MNKKEFIKAVAEKSGMTLSDTKNCLDSAFSTIEDAVGTNGKLFVPDFGTFKKSERSARVARNPLTGEKVHVPAKTNMTFKSAKGLADRFNK